MRREKQRNNNLDHILNTCKDGNGSTTTNILQQLQSVTDQRVERWKKYQEILDEIGKKCNRRVDVRLARNVYTPSMAGQQQRMLKFMESLSDVQLEMKRGKEAAELGRK
jgi:ATP-dependent protease Clp ATPase subunit